MSTTTGTRSPEAPTEVGPTRPKVGVAAVSPAPRRTARREATRQRLLDAAREVFAERGVIGATVEDICDRAGYTRGAFYSNFIDKDDVLEALIEREHGRLLEELDHSLALVEPGFLETNDPTAALTAIVDRILRSIPVDRHLSLVQTEMEIHAVRMPAVSASFRAADAAFRTRIAEFLSAAMTRHGRELLIDAGILTDALVGVMERGVRRALLTGDGADPDAVARAVLPRLLLAASRRRED